MYGGYPNGGHSMQDAMHGYRYGYHPWGAGAPPQPPSMPPSRPDDFDIEDEEDDEQEEVEDENEEDEEVEEVEEEEDQANVEEDDDDEEEEEDDDIDEAEVVEEQKIEDEFKKVEKSELPKNRKRPRPSAFAYLQGLIRDGSYELSPPAKDLLKNLLREKRIQLAEPQTDADYALEQATRRVQSKRVVDAEMSDRETLDLGKKDELSYLGSFLKAIEQGDDKPVTAKYLTRRCCLAVNPAFVPACMDAEDFVLAALEFLESVAVDTSDHPHLPRLPLIQQAMQPENDIRKRAYVKAYPWKLEDILDSISYLENIFLSDASEYKWLRREAFAPMNMDVTALEALLLKGKFRAPSAKKKTPASRNKKAKQAPPFSSGGGSVNSASNDPVATEASSRLAEQAASRSGDDSF